MKTPFSIAWVNLTILLMAVPAGWLAAQGGGEATEGGPSKTTALEGVNATQLEIVRRQEALIGAQLLIKEAENFMAQRDFNKALNTYMEAEKKLPVSAATMAEVDQIRQGAALCLFALAKEAFERGNFTQAVANAEKSYQYNPKNEEALELKERATREAVHSESRKKEETEEVAELPKEITNAEFIQKQKEILRLYRAAENYFKSEQFDQAEASLRDILRIDPYSATAYHRLREVQLAKYKKLGAARQEVESASMLEVQQAWQLPLRRDKSIGTPTEVKPDEDLGTYGQKQAILKKLNAIIIKKIEFENTPISSAINYLVNESREADLPTKEGVNIIPAFEKDLGGSPAAAATPAPAAAPPPAEGGGGFGAPGAAAPAPAAEPATTVATSGLKVTLNLKNIPLLQAIKFLTTVTGLKYRVETDAVVITSGAEVQGPTQTRTFSVAPGIFRSVIERTGGGGGGGGGGGFAPIGAGGSTTTKADVKKIFEEFGITFPTGTSVSYNEALSFLVATHTSGVLDQIEQIILRLNRTPPQVRIEAKFIDVSQSDLEELGFRWAFAQAQQHQWVVESGQGTALPGIPVMNLPPPRPGGGFDLPTTYLGLGNPITSGLRRSDNLTASGLDNLLAGAGGTGTLIASGVNTLLTITGVFTDPQVQIMIDALAQKKLTNLLSAPHVTTTSGESAKILITREFIYPSAFTDPVVSTGTSASTGGTGSVGIVAPSPSSFTTREVGVILDVKPTVGSDNFTITLTVSPEVVDFEGFINYSTFAVANNQSFTFSIPQPVFNKRTLQTSVTIWDGQTVTLGGLIREETVKVNDKVPFLGDLPIVGRFFQSKVESMAKRNLMIFLNSRIVDPAGNPIRQMEGFKPPTVTPEG
ncbi:MAG: hypothetical protein HY360_08005 [Verrucomicrobia bacterium]|nr:hypothetical protein [Verrucomicrobiota bacterium]